MHEMTDEQLRALVARALEGGDAKATALLMEAFEIRVCQGLQRYAGVAMQRRDDAEDAAQEVIERLWKALRRIADPAVEHPWAYVVTVIRNTAIGVGRRSGDLRSHEEPLEERHDRCVVPGPLCFELDDVIKRWSSGLREVEKEPGSVFLTSFECAISVKQVLAERYPDDTTTQNRIEKQITRGKHPGGFIAGLLDALAAEED